MYRFGTLQKLSGFFIINLLLSSGVCQAQALNKIDSTAIVLIMSNQEKCWNNGDIPGFMESYWKSDSLKFIGSKGLTYGWKQTLNNYLSTYPDRQSMGTLKCDIISLEAFSDTVVFVTGKWHLKREKGDIGGHYSLVWRKIEGQWVIVTDHSS